MGASLIGPSPQKLKKLKINRALDSSKIDTPIVVSSFWAAFICMRGVKHKAKDIS